VKIKGSRSKSLMVYRSSYYWSFPTDWNHAGNDEVSPTLGERRNYGRDFLDVSHLNGAPLPSGQDLLDALSKQPMPLRYPVAAPSQQEIELDGLALQIGPVMFRKRGHLCGEADSILPNLLPQLIEREFFNICRSLRARPRTIARQHSTRHRNLNRLVRNRNNSCSHVASQVCGEIHKKGMKGASPAPMRLRRATEPMGRRSRPDC